MLGIVALETGRHNKRQNEQREWRPSRRRRLGGPKSPEHIYL